MSTRKNLSEDEAHAMRLLWDRGSASVSELAQASRQPVLETQNILLRLRRKGPDSIAPGKPGRLRPCAPDLPRAGYGRDRHR